MIVRPKFRLRSPREVAAIVDGLANASLEQMKMGQLPRLYGGTIKYKPEQPGEENWQTAADTAAVGTGDCEDLCAYRIAELRHEGEPDAHAAVFVVRPGLMHILVRRGARGGHKIEDPSARLGMAGGRKWN